MGTDTCRNFYFQAALFFSLSLLCFFNGSLSNDATSPDKNFDSTLDIRAVLNTHNTLWVYWQARQHLSESPTSDVKPTVKGWCKKFIRDSSSETEYNFTEMTGTGYWAFNQTYYGIFVMNDTRNPPKPPKSMVYSVEPGKDLNYYANELLTLVFNDPDKDGCYVFTRTRVTLYSNKIDTPVCMMFMSHDTVDNGPSDGCATFFNRTCNPNPLFTHYDSTCKTGQAQRPKTPPNDITDNNLPAEK